MLHAVEQAAGGAFADLPEWHAVCNAKSPGAFVFYLGFTTHEARPPVLLVCGDPLAPLLEQKRHAGRGALIAQ